MQGRFILFHRLSSWTLSLVALGLRQSWVFKLEETAHITAAGKQKKEGGGTTTIISPFKGIPQMI